jgi:hypothetical protein
MVQREAACGNAADNLLTGGTPLRLIAEVPPQLAQGLGEAIAGTSPAIGSKLKQRKRVAAPVLSRRSDQ